MSTSNLIQPASQLEVARGTSPKYLTSRDLLGLPPVLAKLPDRKAGARMLQNFLSHEDRPTSWRRSRPSLRCRHLAYSPIEQARLLQDPKLVAFAAAADLTPAQVALAWLLARNDVIVIPKTSRAERLKENLAALDATLSAEQCRELDRLFPPPKGPCSLEML